MEYVRHNTKLKASPSASSHRPPSARTFTGQPTNKLNARFAVQLTARATINLLYTIRCLSHHIKSLIIMMDGGQGMDRAVDFGETEIRYFVVASSYRDL